MFLNRLILSSCVSLVLASVPAFGQNSPPQRVRSTNLRRIADRSYLGVGVIELTDDRVKALNLKSDNGVEVKRVEENSAAAKAGLKENDVIVEVNGKTIEDVDQFIRSVADNAPGSKINLTIWRGGAKKTLTAVLDSRPGNQLFIVPDNSLPPMPPMPSFGDNPFETFTDNAPLVGFEGETLSPQLAAYFGVKEGVLVRTVAARTPADKAGLKAGDVVVKVNGTMVMNPREITGLVRSSRSKSVSFTVVRDKKEMTLNVQIIAQNWPLPDHDVL